MKGNALPRRRSTLLGFSSIAILVATAGVAFACIQTIGRLEVIGTNGGSSVAVGNAKHPGAADNY